MQVRTGKESSRDDEFGQQVVDFVQAHNEADLRRQAAAAKNIVFQERPHREHDIFDEFTHLESLYFGDATAPAVFAAGDRVEADYQGQGRWFLGEISSDDSRRDNVYDVLYENGNFEERVSSERIRTVEVAAELPSTRGSHAPHSERQAGLEGEFLPSTDPDEQERKIREQVEFVNAQYLSQKKAHRTRRAADYEHFDDGVTQSSQTRDSAFGFKKRLVARLAKVAMSVAQFQQGMEDLGLSESRAESLASLAVDVRQYVKYAKGKVRRYHSAQL